MMRMQTGLFCALAASMAFAFSCADSGTGDEGDEMEETTGNVCGDATCAASEVGFCTADCGAGGNNANAICGNAMCETSLGENASTCFSDCGAGSGSGSGSGSSTACPSNLLECAPCLIDASLCVAPLTAATCQACLGGGGGSGFGDIGCDGGAPDGTCSANEDAMLCPSDC